MMAEVTARQHDRGLACPSCTAPNESLWRHCGECGERLVDDAVDEESRTVTIVVSDLQGSTELAEKLDPESLRLVLDRYFDELSTVFTSHGGHIEKRIGDAMVTTFGFPTGREDNALRALRATAEAQQTLANLNERLHAGWGVQLVNRTGIATGTMVSASATGAHRVLAGAALDIAAALEPLAPPLEALVSVETVALAGDAAEFGPVRMLTSRGGRELPAQQLLTVVTDDGDTVDGGTADADRCASCGSRRQSGATWCINCGLTLDTAARRAESRRMLTILFADLSLVHTIDDVTAPDERAAMVRVFDTARGILERHGGTVENFIGDAVMAIFGLEQRREDDALRAVRAATEMQDRLLDLREVLERDFGVRLAVTIGVNTGTVIAGDPGAGERLVTGDAVNVAARLEQTAASGDVVIGELTRHLAGPALEVEALAPLSLKGKSEPVPAYRVRAIRQVEDVRSGFELPLVGRDTEMQHLQRLWDQTKSARSWRRVSLIGEAGTGKSRLVHELLDSLTCHHTTLRGACLPYGEGITFWPIAEIVRSAAAINAGDDRSMSMHAIEAVSPDREVAIRLQALAGLDDRTVPVTEISWAVRRLLDHLAAQAPLIVVIDGLHWAEPTLLGILDDLVSTGDDVPALLITMERRAGDDHPGSPLPSDDLEVLRLGPLDEERSHELVVRALGHDALPLSVRERIVRSSEGTPLFIEQLLTMLIGDGRLVRDGDRWTATASIDELTVPPTIEALLAARIDALTEAERAVLQPASVMGDSFSSRAVEDLLSEPALGPTFETLAKRQLIARLGSSDALADHRFRNLMIRDVVYDGLLKRTRSELHRQFADWLAAGPAANRLNEIEEILGYHLERAFLLGAEVASVDSTLIEIGRRAANHLAAAGERAFARGDMPAAGSLLERAARTLLGEGVRAAHLLQLAGDAVFETGSFELAASLYDESESLARDAGAACGVASAKLARCTMRYLTGDGVDDAGARAMVEDLLPIFQSAEDHGGVARCWRLRANIEMIGGRWGAAEAAAMETIAHARRAGDHVLERRVIPALVGCMIYGPTPVGEGLRQCNDLLVDAAGDSRRLALIEQFTGYLLALDGDFDEARRLSTHARESLAELGWSFDAALVSIQLGSIEMMAGRPDAAERVLREDYETLKRMGEQNYLSTTAAVLAEALRRQGRLGEAEALIDESQSMAAPGDLGTQLTWRSTRVKLLRERGLTQEAEATAREAVEFARSTDDLRLAAEASADLAEVLLAGGHHDEARDTALDACRRFRAKGDRVGVARAEQLLEQISGSTEAS